MIEIVQGEEKHFPIIQQIAHTAWPVTFATILSPEQIAYMLEKMYSISSLTTQTKEKDHVFLLAREPDRYLGYISYELRYNGTSKTKIHKIYLLPEAQGKGTGRSLMNRVEAIARENQSTRLTLNVNRNNKAVEFYEALGFTIVGMEDIDIGEGFWMEDFIMDKVIVP